MLKERVREPDPQRFAEFLLKLAEDRDLEREYKANPDAVSKNHNLAQLEIDALKTGDITEIRRMLPLDTSAICVVAMFVTR